MKKCSAFKRCIIAMLAMQLLLSGCLDGHEAESNPSDSITISKSDFSSELKNKSGINLIDENDSLQLYVNGRTAAVSVKEKQSGTEWYTNPANSETDTTAKGDGYSMMNSQLAVTYTNPKDVSSTYYTKTDSVDYDQFSFERIDNGVKVNYIIGKQIKIYVFPPKITKTRMDQFTSKLSEEDKAAVVSMYTLISIKGLSSETQKTMIGQNPALEKDDVYIVLGFNANLAANMIPEYLQQMLEPYFKKAGYTQADMVQDYKENNLAIPENQNAVIRVSVNYQLEGNDLVVTVPYQEIQFDRKKYNLTNVSLLPYFGAADSKSSGYIFVPDGSGALMYLNSGNTNYSPYSKMLYGKDRAISRKSINQGDGSQCYLPVFGIKNGEDAFLSVIEKGDALAIIKADVGGRYNQYNNVSADFNLTPSSTAQAVTTSKTAVITNYQQNIMQSDIKVRYLFLHGTAANYSGMALKYQSYLLAQKKVTKQTIKDADIPFNVNLIGAVKTKSTFMGVPVSKIKALTTYFQAQTILNELVNREIQNIKLTYSGWSNDGISNSAYNKVNLIDSLGGSSGFTRLSNDIKEKNIAFYPDVNLLYVSGGSMFQRFNSNTDAARDISGDIERDKQCDLATLMASDLLPTRFLISPSRYEVFGTDFSKSYQKYSLGGIALNNMGTDLNSDFHRNSQIDRQKAENMLLALADKIAKSHAVSSSGVNAYLLKVVSNVINLPMESGKNYILDQSVPFYQIVLHGIMPYSGEPLNLSTDMQTDLLKMIETGTTPNFEWMYADNAKLKDTSYPYYSLNYKAWISEAAAAYHTVDSVLRDCQNSRIINHMTVQLGLSKTVYENGKIIYVNYNTNAVSVDGIEVAGKNYAVSKQ